MEYGRVFLRVGESENGAKYKAVVKYKDSSSGKWRMKKHALEATGKRAALREAEEWRQSLIDADERAEREAEEAAHAAEREAEEAAARAAAERARETVGEYLAKYVEGRRGRVEESTYSHYKYLAEKVIAPGLGGVALESLDPDTVDAWVGKLSGEYGPITVRKALILLRSAMGQAVDRDRLAKDPTRGVRAPKLPKKKPNALTERECATVLLVLDTAMRRPDPSPHMLGILIALTTGLREGEICALRWDSVDIEGRSLEVTEAIGSMHGAKDPERAGYYIKPPKNDGSDRTVNFPEGLGEALAARRAATREACAAAGVRFSGRLFVLGDPDGSYMRPDALSKKWRELADALDIRGTQGKRPTFHDLRHTYATMSIITSGVDVKTVSHSMGHTEAGMTLDTYTSFDKDAARRAADKLGEVYDALTEGARRESVGLGAPAPGTGA